MRVRLGCWSGGARVCILRVHYIFLRFYAYDIRRLGGGNLVTEKSRTDTITAVLEICHSPCCATPGARCKLSKATNRIHKNIMHYIVGFRIVRHVVSLFAYISRGSMQGTTHLPWEAHGTGMVICFGGMHSCAESNNMGRVGGVANVAQMSSGVSIVARGWRASSPSV
jgi:hypothetical protein